MRKFDADGNEIEEHLETESEVSESNLRNIEQLTMPYIATVIRKTKIL